MKNLLCPPPPARNKDGQPGKLEKAYPGARWCHTTSPVIVPPLATPRFGIRPSIASSVPPTAVTNGELPGYKSPVRRCARRLSWVTRTGHGTHVGRIPGAVNVPSEPASPAAASTVTPSRAARRSADSAAVSARRGTEASHHPNDIVIASTRLPPVLRGFSAASISLGRSCVSTCTEIGYVVSVGPVSNM
ncbi:MAG TPA: hypothetical protein VFW09_18035 [Solirubrobacteraceae bacterium]|nr:hypothetical protein [Solirubrobacteraceae bacterium]